MRVYSRMAANKNPLGSLFSAVHVRDLLIALSLANLCYVRVWQELEDVTLSGMFRMRTLPNTTVLTAVMLNVLLLAAFFTAVISFFRHREAGHLTKFGRAAFVAALGIPLFNLYRVISERYQSLRGEMVRNIGTTQTALVFATAGLLIVLVVLLWQRQVARWAAFFLLIIFPTVLVTFGRSFREIRRIQAGRPDVLVDRPSAPPFAHPTPSPRILWLLFDEWDYRLTFQDRLAGLNLPEIDRFKTTAVYATQAISPSRSTVESLPMLLSGERIYGERLYGPDEFDVKVRPDRQLQPWRSRPLIFSEARALGLNTALAGWYIPYCRVIAGQVSGCFWLPIENQRNSVRRDTLLHAMLDQTRSLFETSLISPFGQSLTVKRHIESYRQILQKTKEFSTDPNCGLFFAHFPIPHPPFFYDRKKGTPTRANSLAGGYYDALALVDRTIGELRQKLESQGLWDNSVIVLTSDHFFRSSHLLDGKIDRRIPFLVKMPHQKEAISYDRPFNTLVTKHLLLSVLRGEVQRPDHVVQWLDRNIDNYK